MDYRDKLIADISEYQCNRILRKTIKRLQKMTKEMLSGDDSPLKNIWDEICVQVQSDYSWMWYSYEDTITAIIEETVKELIFPMLQAIWLQTVLKHPCLMASSVDSRSLPLLII